MYSLSKILFFILLLPLCIRTDNTSLAVFLEFEGEERPIEPLQREIRRLRLLIAQIIAAQIEQQRIEERAYQAQIENLRRHIELVRHRTAHIEQNNRTLENRIRRTQHELERRR